MVDRVPAAVQNVIDSYEIERKAVEWAFRWLYNQPEVSVVLSGVSSLIQLEENIRIFNDSAPNVMSADELQFIDTIKAAYKENQKIGCTSCGYCMPCPQNVDIPEILRMYNDLSMPGYEGHLKFQYTRVMHATGTGADQCIECGECEEKCPQDLPIIETLPKAHKELLNPELLNR